MVNLKRHPARMQMEVGPNYCSQNGSLSGKLHIYIYIYSGYMVGGLNYCSRNIGEVCKRDPHCKLKLSIGTCVVAIQGQSPDAQGGGQHTSILVFFVVHHLLVIEHLLLIILFQLLTDVLTNLRKGLRKPVRCKGGHSQSPMLLSAPRFFGCSLSLPRVCTEALETVQLAYGCSKMCVQKSPVEGEPQGTQLYLVSSILASLVHVQHQQPRGGPLEAPCPWHTPLLACIKVRKPCRFVRPAKRSGKRQLSQLPGSNLA